MARLDRAMDFGPLKIGDRPMFFSRVDGPSQTSLDCVVVFSFHAGQLRGLTGKKSAVFIVGIHTIKWLKSSLLIFLLTYSRNQLRIRIRWQNRKCFYHSTQNNWHARGGDAVCNPLGEVTKPCHFRQALTSHWIEHKYQTFLSCSDWPTPSPILFFFPVGESVKYYY